MTARISPLVALAGLLVGVAAPASARPPARLDAAVARLEALSHDPAGADAAPLARELRRLSLAAPRAQARALRRASQDLATGDAAGAMAKIQVMPPSPEISVQVLGAAQRVTGSAHLLRTPQANILADFGMAQGDEHADGLNWRKLAFDPAEIDLVMVTHAHIDHMGLLPRLVKLGYAGKVLTTPASAALMKISLEDSAKIQWMNAADEVGLRGKWPFGRNEASPEERARIEAKMLYTHADVATTLERLVTVGYERDYTGVPGSVIRFYDAGHLPGSAAIEVVSEVGGERYRVVFGGDTGNIPYPLLRRPQPLPGADLLLLESTYGGKTRDAGDIEARYERFKETIRKSREDGGYILMPAFAVGRSQVILSWLTRMKAEGDLPADTPILLDSPMASKTLKAIARHPEALDPDQIEHLYDKQGRFFFVPGLRMGLKRGQKPRKGAIIIASSGMLTAGRSVGHAQELADEPETDLIFTGHAAPGSPARRIMEGVDSIELGHGHRKRRVHIRCGVHRLSGFSGHADQAMLLEYIRSFDTPPAHVVLVHGEPEHGEALEKKIEADLGIPASFPARGRVYDLKAMRAAAR